MQQRVLTLLAVLCSAVFTIEAIASAPAKERSAAREAMARRERRMCPELEKLISLCSIVNNRSLEREKSEEFRYVYQRKIYEAACVDSTDGSDEEMEKIAAMWTQAEAEDRLRCNLSNFEVTNGNIIKLAISSRFSEFIQDIVNWGVNLNQVDDDDGRTPLDFVSYQIEAYRGTPVELVLRNYYKMLARSGAKHRSELP